jgi:N6-adenosine-specific RNA methylase IME4
MPSLDDILGNPLRPHGAPRSFASVLADPAATPRPFSVIVEDPPWKHGDQLPGAKRGAGKHYDVMPTEAICALALPPIAPDAHLFLWRVASMQQDALDVVRARGFTVKSELVWLKRTKNGKRAFGMGHHVRMEHEICLICTRGRGAGIVNRSQRSTFASELDDDGGGSFEATMAEHSRKPPEFYRIVEGLFSPDVARLELFAREQRPGWTTLGNEVPGAPTTLTSGLSRILK